MNTTSRRPRRFSSVALAVAFGVGVAGAIGWATPVRAQEPSDSLRAELARLRARLDSLEALVRRLQEEGQTEEAEDALTRLRAAAAAAAARGAQPPGPEEPQEAEFAGRQRSLQALNPEISVNVDVFGHLNTDATDEQNFVPREFEFSFQSALDPYSRAKIFVAHEAAGPETVPFEEEGEEGEEEEGGVEIEEGYVEWVGLGAGLTLKMGKFFQRFGTLNRWHGHALPHQSRSLPHIAFIGEENLAQTGLSATWLAPFVGAGTYEATVELTRSSNPLLFGESSEPSILGHLNGFWQMGEALDLDLGLSWMHGDFEGDDASFGRNLYGAEFALTWAPPAQARYRGLVVRGGLMTLDGLSEDGAGVGGSGDDSALGVWGLAEWRLSQSWLVGGRYDWVENPADPTETAWLTGPTLTWWQSEWVRLRLEYDLLGRSFLDDDEGRLWLQVTFAMGPHKHETY